MINKPEILSKSVIKYLFAWLINRIFKTDKKLGQYSDLSMNNNWIKLSLVNPKIGWLKPV